MNNFDVPILFLIFNRPDTTQKVFNVIKEIKPKKLFVAADGPRIGREGETILCQKTRDIIKQINWDCELKTLFRENNLGCGKSVSSAITWFFENVEEGIILEDDCLPMGSFFGFCRLMLEKYRDNKNIGMISGTNYLFGYNDFEYSYYFSKHCYIWGWATWKHSWNLFNLSKNINLNKKVLKKYFDDNLTANYYFDQFNYFENSEIDTWDIQWNATLIKNKLFSIIPLKNQISNIGIIGAHSQENIPLSINMPTENMDLNNVKHPVANIYNKAMDLVSMNNIVYKVVREPFLKKWLVRIINRKNIKILKRTWIYKIYNYVVYKK